MPPRTASPEAPSSPLSTKADNIRADYEQTLHGRHPRPVEAADVDAIGGGGFDGPDIAVSIDVVDEHDMADTGTAGAVDGDVAGLQRIEWSVG
jgi:hypothetical protein